MKVVAIVVTYNGMYWYKRCFDSLCNSTIPVEILVVDNASSDNTVEFIKENYPNIIMFESKVNLGFGQANNIGMRYALENNADFVFLLNQDAWINANTISDLIFIHSKNENYGILSPMHLDKERKTIEKSLLQYLNDFRTTSSELFNDLYFDKPKELYETNYVNAAAWLLPRKTLKVVGGFDPIFLHYGEDDNYLQRVAYHKLKIGICPKLTIIHDTDRRVESTDKFMQDPYKYELTKWTNINIEFKFFSYCSYYTRKIVLNLIKFNKKNLKLYFSYMTCLIMNISKIRVSRKKNICVTSTWL